MFSCLQMTVNQHWSEIGKKEKKSHSNLTQLTEGVVFIQNIRKRTSMFSLSLVEVNKYYKYQVCIRICTVSYIQIPAQYHIFKWKVANKNLNRYSVVIREKKTEIIIVCHFPTDILAQYT